MPTAILTGTALLGCLILWLSARRTQPAATTGGQAPAQNPFELAFAIKFGVLFGLIMLVSKVAQFYFADTGVYVSSAVAGLADADAITLSLSTLANKGTLNPDVAARGIFVAMLSNTLVKVFIAAAFGSRSLKRAVLPVFAVILAVGVALLVYA